MGKDLEEELEGEQDVKLFVQEHRGEGMLSVFFDIAYVLRWFCSLGGKGMYCCRKMRRPCATRTGGVGTFTAL